MSEKNNTEHARRILDVDVREVSLVDRAANLRQFLVIKRLEEKDMGAFDEERSRVMDQAQIEVEKAKKMKEEEEKAAKKKEEEEKAAKMKEEEEKARKKEEEEKACKTPKMEEEEKAMNPMAVAGMISGLKGAPKDAVDKLVGWLKDQKKAMPKEEEGYPSPEKKPAKKDLDGVSLAILEDGSVMLGGQEVLKGKKFTTSRTNTLKEVASQLLKLIGEVDEAAAKSIVETLQQSMPMLAKSPAQEVQAVGTQKSIEESEVVKSLKAEKEELQKKVESFEKARNPSKSVSGEGGTDKQQVKKSLWDGLL